MNLARKITTTKETNHFLLQPNMNVNGRINTLLRVYLCAQSTIFT